MNPVSNVQSHVKSRTVSQNMYLQRVLSMLYSHYVAYCTIHLSWVVYHEILKIIMQMFESTNFASLFQFYVWAKLYLPLPTSLICMMHCSQCQFKQRNGCSRNWAYKYIISSLLRWIKGKETNNNVILLSTA